MKKGSGLGEVWLIGIAFIIGGLFCLILSVKTLIPYHQESKDLYAFNFEEIPLHSNVHGEAFAALDYCAEKYSTTMGIRTSSMSEELYCLIPVYKDDEEEYFIILQVDGYESEYDSLIQATQNYILGKTEDINCEPVPFSGLLDKASSEIYGYAKEWFRDTGYYSTNAEIEQHVLPYCIRTNKMNIIALHIIPVIGVVMLVLGVMAVGALTKDKFAPRKLRMEAVNFNGQEYPIHKFDNVDKLLRSDKRAAAVIELSKITGMTYDESLAVVDRWNTYYY